MLAQFDGGSPKVKFNPICRSLILFNKANKVHLIKAEKFKSEAIQIACWFYNTESVWLPGQGTKRRRSWHEWGQDRKAPLQCLSVKTGPKTLDREEKGERVNAIIAFCPPEAVKFSFLHNTKCCLSLRFCNFEECTKEKKGSQASSIASYLKV